MRMMNIELITCKHPLWEKMIEYAGNCSWKAGASLAKRMASNDFEEHERVIVVMDANEIAGFGALLENDGLDEVYRYTPFLGYVFVDEKYRGQRISAKIVEVASEYAKVLGYLALYVVSGEVGLYEKYGFTCIDTCLVHGRKEQIYKRELQ